MNILSSCLDILDGSTRSLSLLLVLVVIVRTVECRFVEVMQNACDWKGSGLPADLGEVKPIDFQCSAGHVRWTYPSGGLRFTLQLPSGGDFYGCLRADKHFGGSVIYIEEDGELRVLVTPKEKHVVQLTRCFRSRKGQVVLFMEGEPGNTYATAAGFRYDLEMVPPDLHKDAIEACRPCNATEMVMAYCTGDFAVRGTIAAVRNDEHLRETWLDISASKIFHQTTPLFEKRHSSRGHSGAISVSLHCGVRHGKGELMFMGERRLGIPVMKCAPRFKEWQRIRQQAMEEQWNDCSLD